METNPCSSDTSQGHDAGPGSPPYPLTRGASGLWLGRGERLGLAARLIAAAVAAGCERATKWRRHLPAKGPIDTPPPQPG